MAMMTMTRPFSKSSDSILFFVNDSINNILPKLRKGINKSSNIECFLKGINGLFRGKESKKEVSVPYNFSEVMASIRGNNMIKVNTFSKIGNVKVIRILKAVN